ncbi:MAG: serine hydrolase domain-containing protein, partial [Chitinophagaceae bacterium]
MKRIMLVILLVQLLLNGFGQPLPRSTPEAEGVSSEAIMKFIDSYSKEKHEQHSYMIVRHGKVISEGWWAPYAADLKHSMYSVSKSWTSTAIGFAVDEKRFSVNDKVISFFPEYQYLIDSPYVKDLKIKDLLTMSVGNEKEPTGLVVNASEDWVKVFLKYPIKYEPGTRFLYNTAATFMLSAILQRVTGQTLMEYLEPRLFKPLGITGIDWETNPAGVNTGGWGIRVKTEDMAKLGLLYLNQGVYNGQQLLSKEWVSEATSRQILQDPGASNSKRDSSDWLQGYGYQFWRSRHNAFRGDGAFGQYIVMLPEHDAVVIITSESLDLQDDLNMIWDHLLPAFQKESLPTSADSREVLRKKASSLKLTVPVSNLKKGDSKILNHNYKLDNNSLGFESISVNKNHKDISLIISTIDG